MNHDHLRASDADRERVADVLRRAAAEGRIDLAELDERLEATYAAKTFADLRGLTDDLPLHQPPVPHGGGGVPVPVMHYDRSLGGLGSQKRQGVWEIGPVHQATATLGDVLLDLRQVRFTSRETVIRCFSCLGSIKVIVNPATHVILEGTTVLGEFKQKRDRVEPRITPDSPVVRIVGYAVLGDVTVTRRDLPTERKKGRFRR